MARNLRAKIPRSDTLVVYDRNAETSAKFAQEIGAEVKGGNIEVATSSRVIAQKSVSQLSYSYLSLSFISNDEHVLSMI